MLEEEISKFKLGYKICNDAIISKTSPEKDLLGEKTHINRLEALYNSLFFWEAWGYVFSFLKNSVRHPTILYYTFKQK